MKIELTPQQKEVQAEFRQFVNTEVILHADWCDREEKTPQLLIEKLAQKGYLGSLITGQFGGGNLDPISYGLLNEELGRGCSSLRSLLTVHNMVSQALLKWGNSTQKEHLLPKLATGEVIGAFALSEPDIGSDAKNIKTRAELADKSYILNGRKKWITYGQIADVFLLFAQSEGKPCAFLVEKNTPGLHIKPISGMVGVRASMLAELHLDDCRIPAANLVGREGFGFSYVANSALDWGRYSVAWGCVGIARAALEACVKYTSSRQQFNVYLREHQLIRQAISDAVTNIKAARLLCYQAGYLKQVGDPQSIQETSIAKYFASVTASKIASDAVQIHGGNGCSSDYSVQRYWRDAKIMEIIEGSTQIQQINIADCAYQELIESI
jgi:glutaryl-CoA dehydrogenase (non-decarboxylating)